MATTEVPIREISKIISLMRRREEMIDNVLNQCLSGGVGELERMWEHLIVAEETKDKRYIEYAIKTASMIIEEDVRARASYLAKEIERLKDMEKFYGELERKVRREFYDALVKCLAENLPF